MLGSIGKSKITRVPNWVQTLGGTKTGMGILNVNGIIIVSIKHLRMLDLHLGKSHLFSTSLDRLANLSVHSRTACAH